MKRKGPAITARDAMPPADASIESMRQRLRAATANDTGAAPRLPLAGLGVAVTRPEAAGGPLERRLTRLGARVLRWHTLAIEPPADARPLAAAAARLERFDWIVFPSANAVAALARAVDTLRDRTGLPLRRARVAAVGRSTAAAARRAGWRVDRVPEDFRAAGLVESFRAAGDAAGARVLLPQSSLAGDELASRLTALGATVETVEAFRTVPADLDAATCRAQLTAGDLDALTFTSPSAVDALERALGAADFAAALQRLVVSIGPTTTRALLARGRSPDAQADPSTLGGLVAALIGLARR